MAILFTSVGAGLSRTNSFLTKTSSWTRSFWCVFRTDTPSGGKARTLWVLGDATLVGPYIKIGTSVDSNQIKFEAFDGTTNLNFTGPTLTLEKWYYFAVKYDSVGHTLKLFYGAYDIDITEINSISTNLTTYAGFGTNERLGMDASNAWSNLAVAYERTWQSLLTKGQLQEESNSIPGIITTNRISNSVLAVTGTLTDSYGHNWSNLVGMSHWISPVLLSMEQGVFAVGDLIGGGFTYVSLHVNFLAFGETGGTLTIKRCVGSTTCTPTTNIFNGSVNDTVTFKADDSRLQNGIYRYYAIYTYSSITFTSTIYTVIMGARQTTITYSLDDLIGSYLGGTLAPLTSTKTHRMQQMVDDDQLPSWAELISVGFRIDGQNGAPQSQAGGTCLVINYDATDDLVLPDVGGNNFTLPPATDSVCSGVGCHWVKYPSFVTASGLFFFYANNNYKTFGDPPTDNNNPQIGTAAAGIAWTKSSIYACQYGLAVSKYNNASIGDLTYPSRNITQFDVDISYFSPLSVSTYAGATGILRVVKHTVPPGNSQEFDFTATAPLSPTSFTLGDEDIETFTDLEFGIYSVVEVAETGWSATYKIDGDIVDPTMIIVYADETTTLDVYNSNRADGSGLYILVLGGGKRTDTIVDENGDTEEVKIPDPTFKTALLPTEDM